jgi:purine-binding chemotaxis protein CheW
MPNEILLFLLDQQRYALPTILVQELVRAVEIIAVPSTSKWVEGAIDYRGKIVPVLDLRQFVGLSPRAPQATDYLIIGRLNERLFAIRVDRASDVSSLDFGQNEVTAESGCVSTVVHVQDGTAIILDLIPLVAGLTGATQTTEHDRRDTP